MMRKHRNLFNDWWSNPGFPIGVLNKGSSISGPPSLFLDSFVRADGPIGSDWSPAGNFAISGNKLTNTVSLTGAEKVTNGTMESGNPPTGWTNVGGTGCTRSSDPHGGSYALEWTSGAAGSWVQSAAMTLTVGITYQVSFWIKTTGTLRVYSTTYPSGDMLGSAIVNLANYTLFTASFVARTTSERIVFWLESGSGSIILDDVSGKQVVQNTSLTICPQMSQNKFNVCVDVTFGKGLNGLIVSADDMLQNYVAIMASDTGVPLTIVKYLAGAFSAFYPTAGGNISGSNPTIRVMGDGAGGLLVYYDYAVQNISATFLNDAALVNNTRFGVVLTGTATLNNFRADTSKKPLVYWPYGDSKTQGSGDIRTPKPGYPRDISGNVGVEYPNRVARVGFSLTQMAALIDADLAAITDTWKPDYVTFNLGTNAGGGDAEALYIWDAIHVKWPSTKILVAYPLWSVGSGLGFTSISAGAIASRSSFVSVGLDEYIALEHGCNGCDTMTDIYHPNGTLGYPREGVQYDLLLV